MSYAMSQALQAAVFQLLQGDADLTALIGAAIYDAVPTGTLPETYVVLGTETVRDRSDATGDAALHQLTISVQTAVQGFAHAKAVAGTVSDVLHGADLTLSRGRLVFLKFDRATARRSGSANSRRIDLRFHARVEDDTH